MPKRAAPAVAEVARPSFGSASPAATAAIHASVVAPAAKLECSSAMRVPCTVAASTDPAGLAIAIAPVASESTSAAMSSPSASTDDARMQLLVM